MRGKIFAVFGLVVAVIVGVTYALTRASLSDPGSKDEAARAVAAASAQLQVEALRLERWLRGQAGSAKVQELFAIGTESAQKNAAKAAAEGVLEAATAAPDIGGVPLTLVAVVDPQGVVIARNGSNLMSNRDLAKDYPNLKVTLTKGTTGSEIWVNRERQEQMLASYAPIVGSKGELLGGLVVGSALNDERLTNASERTSGGLIAAGVKTGSDDLTIVARSRGVTPELANAVAGAGKSAALAAATTGQPVEIPGLPREYAAIGQRLEGYGGNAVLVGFVRLQKGTAASTLLLPFGGVLALGLVLALIGAHLLDAYISRPVSQIEDGLLTIINGRTDARFELEHDVLGGVATHLNTMLNQVFGVQEDETDAEGRVSRAPTATSFQDALAVDERMAEAGGDPEEARRLRDEPDDAYYARLFREYMDAKKSLGDPVDHVTQSGFVARIMTSERETAEKHGKPVRFKVEVRGREVVLLAVPLA